MIFRSNAEWRFCAGVVPLIDPPTILSLDRYILAQSKRRKRHFVESRQSTPTRHLSRAKSDRRVSFLRANVMPDTSATWLIFTVTMRRFHCHRQRIAYINDRYFKRSDAFSCFFLYPCLCLDVQMKERSLILRPYSFFCGSKIFFSNYVCF